MPAEVRYYSRGHITLLLLVAVIQLDAGLTTGMSRHKGPKQTPRRFRGLQQPDSCCPVGAENLRHLAGSSADCGPLAARLHVC